MEWLGTGTNKQEEKLAWWERALQRDREGVVVREAMFTDV
jgi:hypothetical protein